MLDWLLPALSILTLSLCLLGAAKRIYLWRQGQPNSVAFFSGLMAILPRYLHDLHAVVARDKYISHTHVATAGGFVLSMLLIILIYGFQFAPSFLNPQLLHKLLLASLTLMFFGACFVAIRRIRPPKRLSKGPWSRLPVSLLGFSVSFFLLTLPASGLIATELLPWLLTILLAIISLIALADLLFGMTWGGPMKHAFAGALHLAFHPRQSRFAGGRSTGLKPLDLTIQPPIASTKQKFGVETPADFKWNQLLGFDACVQCGRCENMCPAFAAGQPLNPKKVIQDIVISMSGQKTTDYFGSPYPNQATNLAANVGIHTPIVTNTEQMGIIEADTLWACTTCRACVEECPMFIEHVDAIIDMRRFLTLEQGQTAGQGQQILTNLIATDNPNGHHPDQRMNWAADQDLTLLAQAKRCHVLLWMGDAAFDLRGQRTLRSLVALLKAAKVDFAVLGNEEKDSGDLARRLGDEATFQQLAQANIATLRQYHFEQIISADPHSFHVLANEYPAFGGHYTVKHHTSFLQELTLAGRLHFKANLQETITYHDPCYLGRYNGEFDAPRNLLQTLGANLVEMERSNYRSRCCGGGGGAPITDIAGDQRIPDMRIEDAKATNADIVAVACPQCALMLEGVVTPRPEIKDIAELLQQQLDETALTSATLTSATQPNATAIHKTQASQQQFNEVNNG